MGVVVQNPQESNEYECEKKNMYAVTAKCSAAAAAVISAVGLRRSTAEYTHPYSMMHRRLCTAGIKIALYYHQLLYNEAKPTERSDRGRFSPQAKTPLHNQHREVSMHEPRAEQQQINFSEQSGIF